MADEHISQAVKALKTRLGNEAENLSGAYIAYSIWRDHHTKPNQMDIVASIDAIFDAHPRNTPRITRNEKERLIHLLQSL